MEGSEVEDGEDDNDDDCDGEDGMEMKGKVMAVDEERKGRSCQSICRGCGCVEDADEEEGHNNMGGRWMRMMNAAAAVGVEDDEELGHIVKLGGFVTGPLRGPL